MSDGESQKHSSIASSPLSENPASTSGETSHQPDLREEDEDVAFDLSDPGDMERKLENLSEKEMDELLKQAYKVNLELKKELQRQERAEPNSSGERVKSKTKLTRGSAKSSKSESSSGLPPIRNSSGHKTAGARGFTTLNHRSNTQLYPTSPVKGSRQKAKTAVKQPTSRAKPEWDDRFTF